MKNPVKIFIILKIIESQNQVNPTPMTSKQRNLTSLFIVLVTKTKLPQKKKTKLIAKIGKGIPGFRREAIAAQFQIDGGENSPVTAGIVGLQCAKGPVFALELMLDGEYKVRRNPRKQSEEQQSAKQNQSHSKIH